MENLSPLKVDHAKIKSQFVVDILELLIDDFEGYEKIREQVTFITTKSIEYTRGGVFFGFGRLNGIELHRHFNHELISFSEVTVVNEEFGIIADAILHLNEGYIDYLEVWNKSNSSYPNFELTEYEIQQTWKSSTERKTIKRP